MHCSAGWTAAQISRPSDAKLGHQAADKLHSTTGEQKHRSPWTYHRLQKVANYFLWLDHIKRRTRHFVLSTATVFEPSYIAEQIIKTDPVLASFSICTANELPVQQVHWDDIWGGTYADIIQSCDHNPLVLITFSLSAIYLRFVKFDEILVISGPADVYWVFTAHRAFDGASNCSRQ